YYSEANTSVAYKGLSGMSDMKKVMDSLRAKTIEQVGEEKVYSVTDYLKGEKVNGDGTKEKVLLPKSDVVYLELADGQFICIRPSGTEPKLKIYVLVFADTKEASTQKSATLMSAIKEILK
ncbi:MAG: phospho-sugar mutase, partial [Clostridia bacterium]|nr:phospho-sugar mutase [Clostridia bacterium]